MALAIRDWNVATTSGATGITVTKPAGTVSGDGLCLVLIKDGSDTVTTPPDGSWTYESTLSGVIGGTFEYRVFTKIAGGSEGASFSLSWAGTEAAVAYCYAIQDTDGIDVKGAKLSTGNSSSETVAALTTTVNNTLLVAVAGHEDGSANLASSDGFSELDQTSSGAGVTQEVAAVYSKAGPASAGSTGTMTWTADTSQEFAISVVAWKPIGAATASLASTEENDTLSSSAKVAVATSAAITEAEDTLSASAKVAVAASLAATEEEDTLAASATVFTGANATLAATEEEDALAASTAVKVSTSAAITEEADTLASNAAVAIATSLAATEAEDTLSAASKVAVATSAAITEEEDVLSSATALTVSASLAATEEDDALSASAAVQATAAVSVTEEDDTLSASAAVRVTASAAITEEEDALGAVASVEVDGEAGYFGSGSGAQRKRKERHYLSAFDVPGYLREREALAAEERDQALEKAMRDRKAALNRLKNAAKDRRKQKAERSAMTLSAVGGDVGVIEQRIAVQRKVSQNIPEALPEADIIALLMLGT